MQVFNIDKVRCRGCLQCVTQCPVQAIRLHSHKPEVDSSRCISCGSCARVCSHDAVVQIDNLKAVSSLIQEKRKLIFSIDPACIPLLPEGVSIEMLASALQEFGAWDVADASEAAVAVANEYATIIAERKPDNLVLSSCPVVRKLIERSYPELMNLLAPVASPMIIHGRILKRDFQSAAVVYVTTCPARIEEAVDVRHSTEINAVILLQDLLDALKADGIDPAECEPEPLLSDNCSLGVLTAVSGGMTDCVAHYIPDHRMHCIRAEGISQIIALLNNLKAGSLHHCLIELNACHGCCIGGFTGAQFAQRFSNELKLRAMAGVDREEPYFDVQGIGMSMPAIAAPVAEYVPDEKEIRNVLERIGVATADVQKNCGACGYKTCKERAAAILLRREAPILCLPRVAEEKIDLFRKVYDQLPDAIMLADDTQRIVEFNKEAATLLGLKSDMDSYLFEFLDPGDVQYVIDTGVALQKKRIEIPELFLHAEVSIVPLSVRNLLLVTMSDTTETEMAKEKRLHDSLQTVEMAQKIIDKQMNVAQQIAFLLGETTAETKVTLNRIKQRIMDEEE